jgi:hypothetical protein
MLIEPSLVVMLGGVLLSSSLVTSAAVNIDKTYKYDREAEKFATVGAGIGFSGIILALAAIMYTRLYRTNTHFVIGIFAFVWIILLVLLAISYFAFDYLDKSYHYPLGAKHVLNRIERRLVFASLCICIASVTVGLTYVMTHGIESEFFDDITGGIFELKARFSNILKSDGKQGQKIQEENELENFLNNLKDY